MKKKSIFILAILVLIAAAIVILILLPDNKRTSFYRVEPGNFIQDSRYFRVDNTLRRIYFKKGKEEIQLDEIPSINGYYFYLRGKKQVRITPTVTGNTGFYTYLYLESLSKSDTIDFTMEIHQKGENRLISQMTASKVSHPFFKDLETKKGDLLLLKFNGRGIVYLSQPIFYKKIAGKGISQAKHIIFIGADTLRGDQIGKNVGNIPLTPNMDQFIKDAVYLENTYAQTSWTLPSFMSLFTGLNEYNHDVGIKNALNLEKPYLIEQISKEFITFAYHGGKVMNTRWGFSRGFDYYKKFQPAAALYPRGGQHLFRKAVELLKNAQFPNLFLFLHTYQVHAPYSPPKEFLDQLNKTPKYKKLEAVNYNEPAKTYLPVDEELKYSLKELYQAEVLAFDAYFGEFITKLKELNIYNNAMIVLMSDHGEEFFEHNGWMHSHSLYDELIRVPVIIKFPNSQFKSTRVTGPVGIVDLMPTILSYYGIDYKAAKLDGMNLMPLIQNDQKGKNSRRYVVSTISTGKYFEAIPTKIALLFDDYKLIYNDPFVREELEFFKDYALPPHVPKFELYNLKDDPDETRNIVDNHQRLRDKMMPVILEIRKKILERLSAREKKKPLDKEVEEQLKSLGYL
ncbi:MAG: sulfatase-like hydrolase/transferase [Candidatus Aminicenantes bacterium]|nr:sulfatase-like hydrolase/transferase [Candidatus Aminicenantes bacterium]NIM80064.1 sulfatase-like hydrolase/transferase [Candidatus Aminicenantes bacterium]NIN19407.1 sulfatase-like hydrolase/transferase [Candidatus Aminicenantes bacterium]NIN43306.1 sulfatase-like hydrolase/transferase [Candidatus Aminicenantes bacterium]NIN86050.1 sulfatase-like hydrolase/transferase [Candidatus Aminicenantes bacterium]